MEESALRALATRITGGEREAEAELVRTVRPFVEQVVCGLMRGRGSQDTDDVIQESLAGIVRGIAVVRPDTIGGWVRGLVSNQVRLFFRRERSGGRPKVQYAAEVERPDPTDDIHDAEWRADVLALAASAGARDREVLASLLAGHRPQEIQAILRLTPAQYRTCLERLRDLMAPLRPRGTDRTRDDDSHSDGGSAQGQS